MRKHGHQPRKQGILMSLVVREIDPGKELTPLRTAADQFPRIVTAAVVDKGDAALYINTPRIDQLGQLLLQFFCRIVQHFLLIIAGHDKIEDRRAHSLSSLKIQSPSRSSTSCHFSAPSCVIILRYMESRMMMYFGRASVRRAASDSAWFVSASMPGISV